MADGGWGEEIFYHRKDYVRSIAEVKGAYVAQPLTEKGTSVHVLGYVI